MSTAGRLAAAFEEELRAASPSEERPTVEAALDDQLLAACAHGRAVVLGVALDDETFVRHLARIAARSGARSATAWLGTVAVEDLFLACACAVQAPNAARELRTRHGAALRASIGRIVQGSDTVEIEQELLSGLLVGSEGSSPKIGSYAGQAPLERWLQVSAQRAALMWLRARQAERRAHDAAAAEPAAVGHTDPEAKYVKGRYQGEFETALKEALGRMGERERVLLRLHVVNGLSVESVGKMFAVSQPTASRWLARAREALLAEVKTILSERFGASSREVQSLAGLVASRLDLSLSQLL